MPDDGMTMGVYMDAGLAEIIPAYMAKAGARSRSEFIAKAARHYIAYLQKEDDSEFLTPALESVLDGKLGGLENRMARLMFKLAVEMSMLLHVTASGSGIAGDEIERLKIYCMDEVKRLNGRISFEEAYRHQKE